MDIAGASALVTGAGRGIGRAIALALGGAGAKVALVSRTASELEAVAGAIAAAGGRALVHAGDLRERGVAEAAVARAKEAHGRLQILVNNAGVGAVSPVASLDDETWDRVMDTNVRAVFRLTRAALPQLTAGGGHVFMVSSLAGQNAISGMSAYCASKAALDHFTRCLMLEVRHQGVKVTTLAPGSVDTEFGGPARHGEGDWMLRAEDVAGAVLDLLRTRDEAHLSRVELRPLRPPPRS